MRAEVQHVAVSRSEAEDGQFDELVGPHLEAGYRTALAMLGDRDEAEDAVQEAAIKAWRKIGSLHRAASARSWFLAIVANQCRTVRRGRWWSVLRLPDVRAEPNGEPEREPVDLVRALDRLPYDDRLVLFLHFYLDLPLEEVGAVIGLSAAGAKTRVYRAAKKLRPGLEIQL